MTAEYISGYWLVFVKGKRGDSMLYKEKSGVEVHVVGKRLVVYDNKANVVGQCRILNWKWDVKTKPV